MAGWCWHCCYNDLGTYGWFFGDFFLPLPASESRAVFFLSLSLCLSLSLPFSLSVREKSERAECHNEGGTDVNSHSNSNCQFKQQLPVALNHSGLLLLRALERPQAGDDAAVTAPKYSGIYRYLNNPFTYLGHASTNLRPCCACWVRRA